VHHFVLLRVRDKQAYFLGFSFTWMFFSCVKASSSSIDSSRPTPDCL
jgi:hypothetical protein